MFLLGGGIHSHPLGSTPVRQPFQLLYSLLLIPGGIQTRLGCHSPPFFIGEGGCLEEAGVVGLIIVSCLFIEISKLFSLLLLTIVSLSFRSQPFLIVFCSFFFSLVCLSFALPSWIVECFVRGLSFYRVPLFSSLFFSSFRGWLVWRTCFYRAMLANTVPFLRWICSYRRSSADCKRI